MALQEDAAGNIYDDGYSDSSWAYGPNSGWGGVPSQQDQNGNWYDSLGNLVQQVAPLAPLIAKVATNFTEPYLNNIQSGGLLKDATNMLKSSGAGIANLRAPDLMSLIPKLQLQVQQGTMTPAQAEAAVTSVQGTMSPASMKAVMAAVSGQMSPAQAQAFLQSDSEFQNVQSDQGSIQGQRAALNQLADIGANKGLTEADRAQLAAVMNQTNANAAQQRAAQIQQLQMQGNAGSGAELAARLSGVQGASNQNAMAGADVAKAAQARALQAIQAGLQGNANLNSQMFDQAAKKAAAQDVVNQFNAQAQNTIGLQNAANQQASNQQNFLTANQIALANQQAGNQAGALNAQQQQAANQQNYQTANQFALQNAQNQQAANLANAGYGQQANQANFNMANTIAGTNTGIMNEQAKMPLSVGQQQWQNSLDQQVNAAKAQVGAGTALGKMATDQLTRTNAAASTAPAATTPGVTPGTTAPTSSGSSSSGKKDYSGVGSAAGAVIGSIFPGIGTAIGGAAGGFLGKLFSDEDLKTHKQELSDDEVDQMMASLTGYKYRYKGPKTNPTQTGVMAQDMRDGSVVDTPAGKMIQKPEALSSALAILANQHERIKKLEGGR